MDDHGLSGERCHVCLDLISRHEVAREVDLPEGRVAVHGMCWDTTKLFQIREPGQSVVIECLYSKKGG